MSEIKSASKAAPYIGVVVAPLCWSLGGVLIKSVEWNSFAIGGARSAIAVLVTLLWLRGRIKFNFGWRQMGAAVAQVVYMLSFILSMKLTTAANAAFLNNTSLIYVALFGWIFLKERLSKFDWFLILWIFAGSTFFFIGKLSFEHILGNLCAMLSAIGLAVYALLLRAQKDQSPMESVLLGHTLTCIIGLPFIIYYGPPAGSGWWGIAGLGIIQQGFAHIAFVTAMKKIRAVDCMLIGMIEPVLNPIWVLIFLGEQPSMCALVGSGIILTGVVLKALHIYRCHYS